MNALQVVPTFGWLGIRANAMRFVHDQQVVVPTNPLGKLFVVGHLNGAVKTKGISIGLDGCNGFFLGDDEARADAKSACGFKCCKGFASTYLAAKVGDAFMLEDGDEAVGRLLLIKTKLLNV